MHPGYTVGVGECTQFCMPPEMLLKIFSYLDAVSLLHVACVNKHFYHLASDNPRRRSLIAEYNLSHLTKSNVAVGSDNLVQLFSLNPGLLVGLWKESNEIAFIMVSLHYHQLLERSALGYATVQYVLPPNKPVLDDADPEYGLHYYNLHLDMHSGKHMCMCGTFENLFCRKVIAVPTDAMNLAKDVFLLETINNDIENGYLKLTVVSLKDNTKHIPLIGTVGLSWETSAFKGIVKNCYMMDVTVLDEAQKPFWCFSAPVCMELSSNVSSLYDYMGHIYATDYADSEGIPIEKQKATVINSILEKNYRISLVYSEVMDESYSSAKH
ncbi:UNVERIFIED_CONTAM: hypothetical protein H355_011543 [Colinus virginianus]|nr:hypothetical protein H355_011543 [Colinus virginianus]